MNKAGQSLYSLLGMHYKNTKGMSTMPEESWPDLASTLGRKRVSTSIYAYGNINEVLKKVISYHKIFPSLMF